MFTSTSLQGKQDTRMTDFIYTSFSTNLEPVTVTFPSQEEEGDMRDKGTVSLQCKDGNPVFFFF